MDAFDQLLEERLAAEDELRARAELRIAIVKDLLECSWSSVGIDTVAPAAPTAFGRAAARLRRRLGRLRRPRLRHDGPLLTAVLFICPPRQPRRRMSRSERMYLRRFARLQECVSLACPSAQPTVMTPRHLRFTASASGPGLPLPENGFPTVVRLVGAHNFLETQARSVIINTPQLPVRKMARSIECSSGTAGRGRPGSGHTPRSAGSCHRVGSSVSGWGDCEHPRTSACRVGACSGVGRLRRT